MTKESRKFIITQVQEGNILLGLRETFPQGWELPCGLKKPGEKKSLDTLKRVFGKNPIPSGIEVERVLRKKDNSSTEYVICYYYDFEGRKSLSPAPLKYDRLAWFPIEPVIRGGIKEFNRDDLSILVQVSGLGTA